MKKGFKDNVIVSNNNFGGINNISNVNNNLED